MAISIFLTSILILFLCNVSIRAGIGFGTDYPNWLAYATVIITPIALIVFTVSGLWVIWS